MRGTSLILIIPRRQGGVRARLLRVAANGDRVLAPESIKGWNRELADGPHHVGIDDLIRDTTRLIRRESPGSLAMGSRTSP